MSKWQVFCNMSISIADLGSKRKLSEYVHHYEELQYDRVHVHNQHRRHKRAAVNDNHIVQIGFDSHGRRFDLELKRDHSVFHDNLVIEDSRGHITDLDTSHIYEGSLAGKT